MSESTGVGCGAPEPASTVRDLGLLDELEPGFSQTEVIRRLRAWEEHKGRPMRVLHIGNIANNGYNNAKILNAAGLNCDAIAYDYYHIMGCPEWEDADIVGEIDDDMNPDWWSVDLGGFERPTWFAQGPRDVCTRYLRERWAPSGPDEPERSHQALESARRQRQRAGTASTGASSLWHLREQIPAAAGRRVERFEHRLRHGVAQGRAVGARARLAGFNTRFRVKTFLAGASAESVAGLEPWHPRRVHNAIAWRMRTAWPRSAPSDPAPAPSSASMASRAWDLAAGPARRRAHERRLANQRRQDAARLFDGRCDELIADFGRRFPDRPDQLRREDFTPYRFVVDDWRQTCEHYDLVEGYSTDPLIPMFIGKPYVAYEHGTIRDIPFEDSSIGRLTALSYARANAVVITNPDCKDAADRLGVENPQFIPHLIDRKYYDQAAAQERSLPPGVREPYVFCPARQHWDVKGNDIALRAFAAVCKDHADLQLVVSSWGPDVEASRSLLEELGVLDRVVMIAPLRIRDLIAVTRRAEVLIDQFHFAVFGGIGPTALACGTPLVTNLDHTLSEWCMDRPPYFHAADVSSCTIALAEALSVDRATHAAAQHAWMRGNYWYGDVATRHIELFLAADADARD